MFFTYHQNNTWGQFSYRPGAYSSFVIVEADTAEESNERAEQIGLYFNGEGDCTCCGDRWSPILDDEDGDEVPSIYGEPIDEPHRLSYVTWMPAKTPQGFIHHRDGTTTALYALPQLSNQLVATPWPTDAAA